MTDEQHPALAVLARYEISVYPERMQLMRMGYDESPEGFQRCARVAATRSNPGGALVAAITHDRHLEDEKAAVMQQPRTTGYRFVRGANGEGGGTYVEDPEGVDPLPPGYSFTPAPYRFNADRPNGPKNDEKVATRREWMAQQQDA